MNDISRWIERHADFDPDKPALVFEGREISYAELAVAISTTARALKHSFGITHGDRVAFLAFNGPEFLIVMFACARLGAIFIPLNWRLAPPEHAFMLKNATAKLVICEPAFADHLDALRSTLPDCVFATTGVAPAGWTSLSVARDAAAGEDSNPDVGPDTPLLLVYTSGTTGTPKGAVLTQGAVQWNAFNSQHMHDMNSTDRILTVLPMFHVGGLNIQTTPALYAGATVVLHARFDPGAVLSAIAREQPTLVVLVPATIAALAAHSDWPETDLGSLRAVATGSSIVPLHLLRVFHDRDVPVLQVYGSTETGPVSVYLRTADARRKEGSAGKPALHCRMRIVDDADRDVAAGQPGEILVRGPNVMQEYWAEAEATREVFTNGWFRTGDIGYRDDAGFLFVNDRKKDVVISGGENIYPAELETVLQEIQDIAEAAVVGRPDAKWGEVPVAVVVPSSGTGLEAERVLRCFEGRLAKFKHPKDVVFVDALPRNVMGKVQKPELRRLVSAKTKKGATDT